MELRFETLGVTLPLQLFSCCNGYTCVTQSSEIKAKGYIPKGSVGKFKTMDYSCKVNDLKILSQTI